MNDDLSICLKDVSASYGDERVLEDISFEIHEGERVCILGENGSGKTTLLRVMAGLMPFEGSVRLYGRDIRELKRAEIAGELALLTQHPGAYFPYTVRETVSLGRYIRMKSDKGSALAGLSMEDTQAVDGCIERTGLSGEKDRKLTMLSGGQLQRTFLAQAWAQETPLLLLDEPANHLDLRYQSLLADDLLAWSGRITVTSDGNSHRNTMIGVFHDITMAFRIACRFLILKGGRMIFDGHGADLLGTDALNEAYGMDVISYLKAGVDIFDKR